jgi:hypothetical protein
MKLLGLGSKWYAVVLLCQALLGALTVTAAVQLGRYWLPAPWAIGAGLLMAAWPHSIAINGYLLTETLFGFLCAASLLLWASACQRRSHWLAAASGVAFGAAALTNAVLLPFGVLLAVLTAWRRPRLRKICLTLAIGALLLPVGWSVRNMQIPSGALHSSSRDRALQNLVQGSWPSYHPAWREWIFGDATEKANARTMLNAIDKEYRTLQTSPDQGIENITHRLGQHPLHYAAWYLLRKPYELWAWDIQIGQGDIYPYPTAHSPFRTNRSWLSLEAFCRALNPLLMLLALASVICMITPKRLTGIPDKYADHPALVAIACLLTFVTLVYTALQSEPRYSIPFRSFEILLAMTAAAKIAAWRHRRKHTTAEPAATGSPAQDVLSTATPDGSS